MVGLIVLWLIVFFLKPDSASGSFEKGCGRLLKNLITRNMVCPQQLDHTFLCFAVSDYADRRLHRSRENAQEFLENKLLDLGSECDGPYELRVRARRNYAQDCVEFFSICLKQHCDSDYSKTMVYYSGFIRRRVVDTRATEGFDCTLMMVERNLDARPFTHVVTVEDVDEDDNAAVENEGGPSPNDDPKKGEIIFPLLCLYCFGFIGDSSVPDRDSLNDDDTSEEGTGYFVETIHYDCLHIGAIDNECQIRNLKSDTVMSATNGNKYLFEKLK